ncbi:ATP-binding cassette domain-containing protein [Fulvivirgaceae bacterium BMA12]|uniref:ATP-binding cassette domain-containing protein n=1 Tax=Agaribacillus aureus TaxID=3051825 RepID=A0ABT8L9K7_9BACT|nr:ATP-binding cassette domain-containing protein [Fulvivirgaceae bacterium BMA12]
MNIVVAKNISKKFGDHQALDQVDLNIPQGAIFGLLGPNGAGKTTFIRIVNQIITNDEGEIYINDEKLASHHIRDIGYLPEERGLYKKMKVGEQLLYLARLKGVAKSEATKKINEWLTKFDLKEWKNKNIEDLSKGMQQKIQFIATIIHSPSLIILDEPFSGFDPINASLIKDEILKIRDQGSTIIFSTHRMESVEELCDHIALINRSKKILDGPKLAIKEQFRTNTFEVIHKGDISRLNPSDYDIGENIRFDGDTEKALIQIKNGNSPNHLLSDLIALTEVHGFTEKIPSINDIFIAKVKEENNHE